MLQVFIPRRPVCKDAAYLAGSDAIMVAKLKDAGAIVGGKTNLDHSRRVWLAYVFHTAQ